MNLDEYLDRATEMRNEIAAYDEKIVRLLDERVQLAKKLGRTQKRTFSSRIYTNSRRKEDRIFKHSNFLSRFD